MKITKILKIILLSFFSLLLLNACLPKDPNERYYKMAEYFSDYVIDANNDQQQKLKEIVSSGLEFHKKLMPINRSLYDEVTMSLKNGKLNEEQVKNLVYQKYSLQTEMINREMTKISQIIASLNEKQRKQTLEHLEEFKEDSLWFQFALGELNKI